MAPSLHSFWIGVISSFFSSSILGTYQSGEFIFQYPIFLPFHTVHGVLKARILKWFAIPFSSGGMSWWWPDAGLEALSVAVHAWDLLKEVTIVFITSTIVWPQANSREGTQLHLSTENWIKGLLSMVPAIRTRPNFPLSQPTITGN